jgi:hypothetical protein
VGGVAALLASVPFGSGVDITCGDGPWAALGEVLVVVGLTSGEVALSSARAIDP